ncbi:hypothetical protein GCM10020216_088080 [Nonomuraea helvata]
MGGTRARVRRDRGHTSRLPQRTAPSARSSPRPNLDPDKWTPRELRHSFLSLLSGQGIPLEEIARLVGHSSTAVTELVYRKQIRPVLQEGAVAMDRIFKT